MIELCLIGLVASGAFAVTEMALFLKDQKGTHYR
jgi:hypothetical protein